MGSGAIVGRKLLSLVNPTSSGQAKNISRYRTVYKVSMVPLKKSYNPLKTVRAVIREGVGVFSGGVGAAFGYLASLQITDTPSICAKFSVSAPEH